MAKLFMGENELNGVGYEKFGRIREMTRAEYTNLAVKDPDTIYVITDEECIAATKQYVDEKMAQFDAIPSGLISLWSGASEAIPAGWLLCNGENGTPDLRDRFVVGAGGEYAVGDIGGEKEHTLTVDEMPSHSHDYQGYGYSGSGQGSLCTGSTSGAIKSDGAIKSAGGGQPHENRPPYYALCYIMKQ